MWIKSDLQGFLVEGVYRGAKSDGFHPQSGRFTEQICYQSPASSEIGKIYKRISKLYFFEMVFERSVKFGFLLKEKFEISGVK